MDLASLKRHMPSIEDGRWVTSEEIRELRDVRVKVRGASSQAARDMFAAKERAIEPRERDAQGRIKPAAMQRILTETLVEWNLVEIEGLTLGGKKLATADVAKLLPLPEYQPVADLVMQAVAMVDATREAQAESLSGN